VVASKPGPKSLYLKVELQTTDTGEVLATNALLDCGATGLFIDTEYVKWKWLTVRNLARPIPVYNVDGTLKEAGAISGIVDVVIQYKGHTEHAQTAVTSLGKQDLILSYTWLHEHNPEVHWQTNMIKMSCWQTAAPAPRKSRQKTEKSIRKLVMVKHVTPNPRKERGAVVSQLHQFLLAVHPGFLPPCPATFQPRQQKCTMDMGGSTTNSIQ
jgi:hypothetical protein